MTSGDTPSSSARTPPRGSSAAPAPPPPPPRPRRRPPAGRPPPPPPPPPPRPRGPTKRGGTPFAPCGGGPADAKNLKEIALFCEFRSPGTRSAATEIVCVPAVKFQDSMWTVNPSPAFRYGTVVLLRILGTPATVSFTQTEKLRDTFSSPEFLIDASIVAC